jgi:hypothetical protein
MPYYMGDYYMGDPGFFSVLGGLAKTAVGLIPGVGPIASKGIELASAAIGGAKKTSLVSKGASAAKAAGALALKHPVLTGAGAAGLGAIAGAGASRVLRKPGALPTLGGGRKHRRMRATNPKALRRALRRAYAFERIAMKTIRLVHPRKHGKFAGFKKAKRRV